jgi:hypothetical protein
MPNLPPIPAYAKPLITMTDLDGRPCLRYGHEGPLLACWPTGAAQPVWDGVVRVGGFVERLNAREVADMEIVIAEIVGGVFPVGYGDLPTLNDMNAGIYARAAYEEPFGKGFTYPFILIADSNFAALVQDALISGLAVDATGHLADQESAWHELCGLPLLMDSFTLLGPG